MDEIDKSLSEPEDGGAPPPPASQAQTSWRNEFQYRRVIAQVVISLLSVAIVALLARIFPVIRNIFSALLTFGFASLRDAPYRTAAGNPTTEPSLSVFASVFTSLAVGMLFAVLATRSKLNSSLEEIAKTPVDKLEAAGRGMKGLIRRTERLNSAHQLAEQALLLEEIRGALKTEDAAARIAAARAKLDAVKTKIHESVVEWLPAKQSLQAEQDGSRLRMKSSMRRIYFLMAAFIGLTAQTVSSTSRAVTIWNEFHTNVRICSPYLAPGQSATLESRFAQMTTHGDYDLVLADLKVVADRNGLKIRDDVW
jgi:hypothetical protein